MQTSASNFSCDAFDKDHTNKVMKGTYTCQGGVAKPSGAGSKPASSAKPSGTNSPAHQLNVQYPAVIGGTSILAGLLQLLL